MKGKAYTLKECVVKQHGEVIRFPKRAVTEGQYNAAVQTKYLTEREMKKLVEANGPMAQHSALYGQLKEAHGIASSRIRSYNKRKK